MNRFLLKIYPALCTIVFCVVLSGCRLTEKTYSLIGDMEFSYTYDQTKDKTRIDLKAYINNTSICGMSSITLRVNCYSDGEMVTYSEKRFNCNIRNNKTSKILCVFEVDGKIDEGRLISWKPEYRSFKETYRLWIVVTTVVLVFLTMIALALGAKVNSLRFHLFLIGVVLIPYVTFGYATGSWSWVPLVILLIAAFLLTCSVYICTFLRKNDPEAGYLEDEAFGDEGKLTYKSRTGIRLDDIAGMEEAKKAFREKVILPITHGDLYEKYNKKIGGGLLLYGLPGTGKTMFAEAVSNEIDAVFFSLKCSDIKSKWYGESEKQVRSIFEKAREAKRAVIFFDEFEAIGAKRTDEAVNANNDLVPEILAEMQGVGTSDNEALIFVIAATNKPWMIDTAFLRPGRFDEMIYIPLPDRAARKKMFEMQLSDLPHDEGLDTDSLVRLTEGCNGADIKEVCEKLKMNAIVESISSGKEHKIGKKDIEEVRDKIKSSVSAEDLEKLKEFNERNSI